MKSGGIVRMKKMKKAHCGILKKALAGALAASMIGLLPMTALADSSGGYGSNWPLLTSATTMGSSNTDYYNAVAATSGGCIAVGFESASDGDWASYNLAGGGVIAGYTGSGSSAKVSWVKSPKTVKTTKTDVDLIRSGTTTHTSTTTNYFFDFNDICRLADGSYIVVGDNQCPTYQSSTQSGGVTGIISTTSTSTYSLTDNAGNNYTIRNYHDASADGNEGVLLHLDASGKILDIQAVGGSGDDQIKTVSATSDGGFVVSGATTSTDGDFTGVNTASTKESFVGKFGSDLSKDWVKCYDGMEINSARPAVGGGYVLSGDSSYGTASLTDTSGHATTMYDTKGDAVVCKADAKGNLDWIAHAGGTAADYFNNTIPTSDGGCLAVGVSQSDDHDMADSAGNSLKKSIGESSFPGQDAIIAKYAADGTREWFKNYAGTAWFNAFYSAVQNNDGSYLVYGGTTASTGADIASADTSPNGGKDFWFLSISPSGALEKSVLLGGSVDEQVMNSDGANALIDTGTQYMAVGMTSSADGLFTKNEGVDDAALMFLNYDYDGDGVPNNLDYYPNDATKSLPPAGALDPASTAAKTIGDGSTNTVSASADSLLTGDNGAQLTANQNIALRISGATFNVPAGLLSYLMRNNGVSSVTLGAKLSDASVSLQDDETLIGSFELSMTDSAGNALTNDDFGGNVQVSFTFPASEASNFNSDKVTTLYHIKPDSTREPITGATFTKNTDGSLTVTFLTSHCSSYAVVQTTDTSNNGSTGGSGTTGSTGTTGTTTASTSSATSTPSIVSNPETGDPDGGMGSHTAKAHANPALCILLGLLGMSAIGTASVAFFRRRHG